MTKEIFIVFIIFAVSLVLVGCQSNQPTESSDTPPASPSVSDDGMNYTLEQVAEHSFADDCWQVVSGKVYDVTEYIAQHPGKAILEGCGLEATEMYDTKGGLDRPHSSRADDLLKKYYIGDLK